MTRIIVLIIVLLITVASVACTSSLAQDPKLLYYGRVNSVQGYRAIVTADGAVAINSYVEILDENANVVNTSWTVHYYDKFEPGIYYVYETSRCYVVSPIKIINWVNISDTDKSGGSQ